jgi:hypothetical protein
MLHLAYDSDITKDGWAQSAPHRSVTSSPRNSEGLIRCTGGKMTAILKAVLYWFVIPALWIVGTAALGYAYSRGAKRRKSE